MAVGGALTACATQSNDGTEMLSGLDGTVGAKDAGGSANAGTATDTGGTSSSGSASGGTSGTTVTAGSSSAGSSSGGTAEGGAGMGGTSTTSGTGGGGGGASGSTASGGSAGAVGNDACPGDPNKTAPGKCGCGVPDQDSADGAGCGPLQDSIIHRYSFETDAKDSVGNAHGTLMGGATLSDGALVLAGGKSGQYLDLPNALISTLTDVTIEVFVTWTGSAGGDWQRVFDFGSSDQPEGMAGNGNKYLFLSARTFRVYYQSATPKAEIFADSSTTFPDSTATHVAVTVDTAAQKLSLYLEGNPVASVALTSPLSAINDVNNWIGRSQYVNDEYFAGKISEIRMYSAALTGPQLKTSIAMGENTTYLKK